jgi:hypothetical protein
MVDVDPAETICLAAGPHVLVVRALIRVMCYIVLLYCQTIGSQACGLDSVH